MQKIVLLWTLCASVVCFAAQPAESHVQDIVAGFGNSYKTDGDFLRYIGMQNLPGGARPLAVMINGGEAVSGYSEHFPCVEQAAVVGNVGSLMKEECE